MSDPAEDHRREELHRLERWTARQPGRGPGRPDKITVLRLRQRGFPGGEARYFLCRWSLAARVVRDAASALPGFEVTDLGPGALLLAQAAQRGDFHVGEMVLVGIALGNRWLAWLPPAPVEPVPGTPGAAGQKN